MSISRHTRTPPTRTKNFKLRAAKIAFAEDATEMALATELARHTRAVTRIIRTSKTTMKQEL